MSHIRTASALPVSLLLLVATAGPALAGPAPIEGEPAVGGGSSAPLVDTSADMSTWLAAGLGGGIVLVLVALVIAAMILLRHGGRSPHAA